MAVDLRRRGSRQITLLAPTTITTPVTGVTTTPITNLLSLEALTVQATLTYGSGVTVTAKAWVQTSFDEGATWVDIMGFAFAAATATIIHSVRLTSAVAANYTPTDGTLADNTIKDGLLGDRLRVKYTTTGTYGGGTTLRLDAFSKA